MTSPSEAGRRNAALHIMRQFAHERGFVLGEIREVDTDTHVELISTAPDGREFGIGYQKVDEPTAYNYEMQGTGYDRDAVGYERLGRKQAP